MMGHCMSIWVSCRVVCRLSRYHSTSLSISLTNPNYDTLLKRIKYENLYYEVKVFIMDIKKRSHYAQIHKLPVNFRHKHSIWNLETNVFKQECWTFISNDSLNFCITIRDDAAVTVERCPSRDKSIQTSREKDDVPCLDSLSADFSKLLLSGPKHDVIVKSGSCYVRAHKMVLSSRSGVFTAMFKSNMTERENGIVDIENINPLDLNGFIKYLYTGKVKILTEESAIRFYKIADKYMVESLKKKCSAFLVEGLSPANACKHLFLAHTYNDVSFKLTVINFIIKGEGIMMSREWATISAQDPQLGMEVFRAHFEENNRRKQVDNISNKSCSSK